MRSRFGLRAWAAGLGLAISLAGASRGDGLDLAVARLKLADPAIPIEERTRYALEAAASLDRVAQQATDAGERRGRWAEAATLLDEFVEKNPTIPAAGLVRFQAAVYRWAEGQSFADHFELNPAEDLALDGAVLSFDDAIRRLRKVAIPPSEKGEVFAQNVRYRLGQAIADRAKLDPEGDLSRVASEREALGLLDTSLKAPDILQFARLLRADLSNRLGLYGQSQMEVEQAEKLAPGPPLPALLEVKVVSLAGRRHFDEASKAIDAAKVGDPWKTLMRVRLLLIRWKEKAPGAERQEIDAEAFRVAGGLRGSSRREARLALMELARTIDEPSTDAPPDRWDLLAEGHLRLGDPARAGRLLAKGGDRAEAIGKPDQAASLRFKSAACLFEAEKYGEVDVKLGQVIGASGAPRDLQARAGMLRALARGRALAAKIPQATREAYLEALTSQVRDFPREPSTGEARWLLGQIRLASGQSGEALDLWSGILHGHARWLEARCLIADRLQQAVEVQTINRDSAAILAKLDLARKSLRPALGEAVEGTEATTLSLKLARLELIPDAGKPPLALDACDRVLKGAARPEQHQTARLYRLVALAQSGRATEAEALARAASHDDPATLMPVLRLLDRTASGLDGEAGRRRIGLVMRTLTAWMVENLDPLPTPLRDEARLHHARAVLFGGEPAAAKREVAAWGGPAEPLDDDLLRELADLYQRLDAYTLAIDAERFRSSRLVPGSLPWFESRYGMSLAYYRSDRIVDAKQIIDGTAILHPDLGGGDLKLRFERLRQKMARE